MTITRDGRQHLGPVGEEKSVTDIEKNDAPFGHQFILQNVSARIRRSGTALTVLMLLGLPAMTRAEKDCNIQLTVRFLVFGAAHGFFSDHINDSWLRADHPGSDRTS
jgi:hypothetical protein